VKEEWWEFCEKKKVLVLVDVTCSECSEDCPIRDRYLLRKEQRYGWFESIYKNCLEYSKGEEVGLKGGVCLIETTGNGSLRAVVGFTSLGRHRLIWDIYESKTFSIDEVLEAMTWVERTVLKYLEVHD